MPFSSYASVPAYITLFSVGPPAATFTSGGVDPRAGVFPGSNPAFSSGTYRSINELPPSSGLYSNLGNDPFVFVTATTNANGPSSCTPYLSHSAMPRQSAKPQSDTFGSIEARLSQLQQQVGGLHNPLDFLASSGRSGPKPHAHGHDTTIELLDQLQALRGDIQNNTDAVRNANVWLELQLLQREKDKYSSSTSDSSREIVDNSQALPIPVIKTTWDKIETVPGDERTATHRKYTLPLPHRKMEVDFSQLGETGNAYILVEKPRQRSDTSRRRSATRQESRGYRSPKLRVHSPGTDVEGTIADADEMSWPPMGYNERTRAHETPTNHSQRSAFQSEGSYYGELHQGENGDASVLANQEPYHGQKQCSSGADRRSSMRPGHRAQPRTRARVKFTDDDEKGPWVSARGTEYGPILVQVEDEEMGEGWGRDAGMSSALRYGSKLRSSDQSPGRWGGTQQGYPGGLPRSWEDPRL